jgi:hypothetical protein
MPVARIYSNWVSRGMRNGAQYFRLSIEDPRCPGSRPTLFSGKGPAYLRSPARYFAAQIAEMRHLTALLFLTGIYALFGGWDALAAYTLTQFAHLLIILAEIGGSVFLGALGGAFDQYSQVDLCSSQFRYGIQGKQVNSVAIGCKSGVQPKTHQAAICPLRLH